MANLKDSFNIAAESGHPYLVPDNSSGAETFGPIILQILSLVGVLFIILMIYAGILWMTAKGDEKKVEKATSIIKQAIIGIIIVLAAYAITYFIMANFFQR